MARFFLAFTQLESCGKCIQCRWGTKQMLGILEDITSGRGRLDDIDLLIELSEAVKNGSRCGLGQTAPNPVLTTLRYFYDEYETHVEDKKCPAKVCLALVEFHIDPEKCNGCGLCLKACDSGAISGEKKKPHKIDQSICVKCGKCITVCRQEAVEKR